MQEANRPEYFEDAFFIKHFHLYPEGFDYTNLFPEQKEFLIMLLSRIPSMETMENWVKYEMEIEIIKKKDYSNNMDINSRLVEMAARMKGISFEEYIQGVQDKLRKEDIQNIKEKYGIITQEENEESPRDKVMKKYTEIISKMENNPEVQKNVNLDRFFNKPQT